MSKRYYSVNWTRFYFVGGTEVVKANSKKEAIDILDEVIGNHTHSIDYSHDKIEAYKITEKDFNKNLEHNSFNEYVETAANTLTKGIL